MAICDVAKKVKYPLYTKANQDRCDMFYPELETYQTGFLASVHHSLVNYRSAIYNNNISPWYSFLPLYFHSKMPHGIFFNTILTFHTRDLFLH